MNWFYGFFNLMHIRLSCMKVLWTNIYIIFIYWFPQVLLYGGQIVSWKNDQKQELLFKSSKVRN